MKEQFLAIVESGQQAGIKAWELSNDLGPYFKDHPEAIVPILGVLAAAASFSALISSELAKKKDVDIDKKS